MDLLPRTALTEFTLRLEEEAYRYRTPMKFGGRVVTDVTVVNVHCDTTLADGRRGCGLGSMTMGVAWAWPDPEIQDATKLSIIVKLARRIAAAFESSGETGHPIEICVRLAATRKRIATEVAEQYGLTQPIPELAVLLAGSPIEAALFDAHGKAAGASSYALLTSEHLPSDLGELLHDEAYRGLTLDQFISPRPSDTLPLYHLVGALDPLTPADVEAPVNDGLPETLGDWIQRNELTHLKIKLNGDDPNWDLERIIKIHDVANQTLHRGSSTGKPYWYSLDFNERCPNEEYVLQLLTDLQTRCPEGYDRVEYIEQPTARDLTRPDAVTMHRVAERKPVVIDESLTDLASLRLAVSQGYTGIALKACKGHSEALLLGAVARHEGLFLCVQDLTCVGASLLHSASLSAHIPGVAAVESNGRQYCPEGNSSWMNRYQPMFEIRGGEVPTNLLAGDGLGYELP
ncbi:mandelate racemase/muconate lactonizing enzyme family protein [Aporhodopirellula aestuarii]|uniref:Mandelate racemase/muconate lactonizing enzyme family protein n=1 Tax=Aporhodopirellula aestuarii TaxID=2950107 RepID=A0ABT0U140_9BACT|nr:mandelate racemase/muconate lactonizing enzyme family protein [Aporhodopirellula aestuarii]MCM2370588.1 mandelate racemase/muconate lactonizing enzyme family protein [Aporhodopirellula aestuarii]